MGWYGLTSGSTPRCEGNIDNSINYNDNINYNDKNHIMITIIIIFKKRSSSTRCNFCSGTMELLLGYDGTSPQVQGSDGRKRLRRQWRHGGQRRLRATAKRAGELWTRLRSCEAGWEVTGLVTMFVGFN